MVVPEEIERGPAEILRARAGHDVDDPTGRPAVLRVERALDDLVLPHGLLREGRADRPDGRVVVIEPINEDVVVAGALPVDREPGSRAGTRLRRSVNRDTGCGQSKLEKISLIDREVPNLPLSDRLGDLGGCSIDQVGFRPHRHGLGHGEEPQAYLNARRGPDHHSDVRELDRLESGRRRCD